MRPFTASTISGSVSMVDLLVEGFLAADRRHHDRGVVFHAQNVDAHVDLADVDQPARAQDEFQEILAV